MMKKQICDRYNIPPGEVRVLKEAYGEGMKALEGAITYMEERVRIYAMPCRWEAESLPDGGILVKRYRNKIEKVKVEVKSFGDCDVIFEDSRLG